MQNVDAKELSYWPPLSREKFHGSQQTLRFSALITALSKSYRPEARGYVVYSPRASHNHELKVDKRFIFTLARIPQVMQKYTKEKCLYCSSFVCFSTLYADTGGIHKFLGFLIMLVF